MKEKMEESVLSESPYVYIFIIFIIYKQFKKDKNDNVIFK